MLETCAYFNDTTTIKKRHIAIKYYVENQSKRETKFNTTEIIEGLLLIAKELLDDQLQK